MTYYKGAIQREAHRETAKAICFDLYHGRFGQESESLWLPKSQIKWGKKDNDSGWVEIYVPAWLLRNKGLSPDSVGIEWANGEEIRVEM